MKGFTLVELVVVISVMAILSAVAMPRFMGSDSFDTRGDFGLVLSSVRYAQKMALTQHTTVYVRVDTVNRLIKLCYSSSCDSLLQDPVTGSNYQQSFNRNVLVTPSVATLGFLSDGTPTPNADATYTVVNSKNALQTSTIKVEANTGYVHKQ